MPENLDSHFRKWSGAMAERMNRDLVMRKQLKRWIFSPRTFVLTRDDLPG